MEALEPLLDDFTWAGEEELNEEKEDKVEEREFSFGGLRHEFVGSGWLGAFAVPGRLIGLLLGP